MNKALVVHSTEGFLLIIYRTTLRRLVVAELAEWLIAVPCMWLSGKRWPWHVGTEDRNFGGLLTTIASQVGRLDDHRRTVISTAIIPRWLAKLYAPDWTGWPMDEEDDE